ncbi:MAG: UDP-2,3-diacylglucosamine diphosphatase [Candidatus Zixiibacteriota bacterium]|nr:MAG: UDP-2,3-diacylglucosamine diphosphatase [candidate division Zixibacteria bacterium]
MALYIFSDAHLGSGNPHQESDKVARIEALCKLVKKDGDRLVILGDLFDFWFEYRYTIPKDYHDVLFILYDLRRSGIQIDYVSGNHDFWMDDFFRTRLEIDVHRDRLDLSYDGRMIHLTHGDGLAPADRGYRMLKKILRNRFAVWLYRKLPPDWAYPLARFVSSSSRSYTSSRDHTFAPAYEAYAKSKIAEGFDVVAIGHLHIADIQEIGHGTYISTGDFINHFSYVKIDSGKTNLEFL